MHRSIILLFLLLLSACDHDITYYDFVEFEDPQVEMCAKSWLVDAGIVLEEGEAITMEQAQKLKVFKCCATGLFSLRGIESFENLEVVELGAQGFDMDLKDLSSLGSLNNLSELHIEYAELDDSVDFSFLGGLSKLEVLLLSNNNLTKIPSIATPSAAKMIFFTMNQLSDLEGIEKFAPVATALNIDGNKISDLSPFSKMSKVSTLHMVGNYVLSLEPLRDMATLRYLELSDNCITDFSPVEHVADVHGMDEQDLSRCE